MKFGIPKISLVAVIFFSSISCAEKIEFMPPRKLSREEVCKILVEKNRERMPKQVHQKETLLQMINELVAQLAPFVIPIVTAYLFEHLRTSVCDRLASKVPDSYQLIDQAFLKINTRDVARFGLEGASHFALWAFLNGSRDENDDFKLNLSKETVANALEQSIKYTVLNNIVVPNLKNRQIVSDPKKNKRIKYIIFKGISNYQMFYYSYKQIERIYKMYKH